MNDMTRIIRRLGIATNLALLSTLGIALPLRAQSDFAAEYRDVTASSGVLSATSSVTVWITAKWGADAYRFEFEPGASSAPSLTWWIRRSNVSRVQVPCSAPAQGQLTLSCPLAWPTDLQTSTFEQELRTAGALPLPDTVPIGATPLRPCPNDGFHLWIVARGTELDGQVEFCNFRYNWVDQRAPTQTISALNSVLRRIRGTAWQFPP